MAGLFPMPCAHVAALRSGHLSCGMQAQTGADEAAREFALSTLANATLDDVHAAELLKPQHVHVLTQALSDPSPGIRGEAYGALRNISCLGNDACMRLLETGLLDVLADLFATVRRAGRGGVCFCYAGLYSNINKITVSRHGGGVRGRGHQGEPVPT